uniref:Uncharacterized protein n=1 Tax=Avena sativa TaxID=4498 RepID=A0ACD5UK11_AVESA
MGLQLEECRGEDDAQRDGGGEKEQAAAGCHTPRRAAQVAGAGTIGECPPAPRKRRPVASASALVARRSRGFYAGADLEAFFAAHDL